jgi:protein-L-isoaspartate(D-aspartate) O-methyltransferase
VLLGTLNYQEQREEMVANQLRGRDIDDVRVLARMVVVPRHCFVPRALASQAYADHPLPIGNGQTISQPYMVACMTALLNLKRGDRVLEIGTGSGYHTAVLAGLCAEVVSVEFIPALHERAKACLGQLGITNVSLHCGDGSTGYAPGNPYDAIVVAAGSPHIPPRLTKQLNDMGRLVCPVGDRKCQSLLRIEKRGDELTTTTHTNCIFVPLVGENGWPEKQ